jgi:hypothetical protein
LINLFGYSGLLQGYFEGMADGGCLEVFFFDCFVHGLSCHLTFFVGG